MVKRKASIKSVSKQSCNNLINKDLQLLDMLIHKFIENLKQNGLEPRAQDALKAIHLKQKLAKTSEKEQIFWELIDQISKDEQRRAKSQASGTGSVEKRKEK
jgi:hypothetical protein